MQYIAETLVRYQRLQNDFEDARVRQAAAELSAELEAMRSALHPATELVIDDRQGHPSDEQALKMVQTFYRIFEPAKRDELFRVRSGTLLPTNRNQCTSWWLTYAFAG